MLLLSLFLLSLLLLVVVVVVDVDVVVVVVVEGVSFALVAKMHSRCFIFSDSSLLLLSSFSGGLSLAFAQTSSCSILDSELFAGYSEEGTKRTRWGSTQVFAC